MTISVCMIVKDEADILARCLDCVTGFADEIIVVDTGSADNTKKIAARYTDKIYDFTWIHDFAAARNFAFAKASGDYIYSADADEVISPENIEKIKQLKEVMLPEIDIVQMYYANQLSFGTIYNYDKEYRPKLFKRIRTFEWIDPVHETVRTQPVVFDSEIEITHLPKEQHTSRDLAVFRRVLEQGEELSERLFSLYAKELLVSGEKEDLLSAREYFEQATEREGISLEQIKEASCVIARAARLQGEEAVFFKYALKDVASEGSSEICCEIGQYFMDHGDYAEAAMWFYNAAFETQSIMYLRSSGDIPRLLLAECYRELGLAQQEQEYRELAAAWQAAAGSQ